MELAIDSRPLAADIFASSDHSGMQLYGLEHLPLHRALKEAVPTPDRRCWNLTLESALWDDGQTITAGEYLEGLGRLLEANRRLAAWLNARVARVAYTENRITFEFRHPMAAVSLFQICNWVPYRRGHRSGPFRLQVDGDGWLLQCRDGRRGRVHLVSSPEENDRLFEGGRLDYSADTAIRLESVDGSVQRQDTGLFGALVYSRNLEDADSLTGALNGLRFSPDLERNYPRLEGSGGREGSRPSTLRLAYDSFYPNREIVEQVAVHLRNQGWQVELVQDDYYRPQAVADAKFMILRGLARQGLGWAWMLPAFPRSHQWNMEIGARTSQVEAGRPFEMRWLSELGLAYPLFTIPSLFRTRRHEPNPLLEVFA